MTVATTRPVARRRPGKAMRAAPAGPLAGDGIPVAGPVGTVPAMIRARADGRPSPGPQDVHRGPATWPTATLVASQASSTAARMVGDRQDVEDRAGTGPATRRMAAFAWG